MPDPQIYGRYVWSEPLDGSIDTIGRYIGKFEEGQLPTINLEGQEYLDATTLTFFKYNGQTWVEMSSSFIGLYDSFPTLDGNAIGKEVYRTDLDAFFKWNGNEWVEVGAVGVGAGLPVTNREDSFPSDVPTGTVVYREDLQQFFVYRETNDTWYLLSAKQMYLGTYDGSFPSNPEEGQEVYREDIGEFFKYNGEYWLEI